MSIVWGKEWKCDLCSHRWMRKDGVVPRKQCPKCGKTGWDISGDQTGNPEIPHADALPTSSARVSVAPGGSISDLKARFGLKSAAELFTSGSATPPAETSKVPAAKMCREDGSDLKRPFNSRRPDWYNCIRRSDVYECVQDNETGQWFVQQGGRGREFPSQSAALEYCDSIDFS